MSDDREAFPVPQTEGGFGRKMFAAAYGANRSPKGGAREFLAGSERPEARYSRRI